jgi:hypothetical protein
VCENIVSLHAAISTIEAWYELNDIELNKTKSGIMIINCNRELAKDHIKGIPIVDEYKYLGVLLGNDLDVKRHITSVKSKVSSYFERYSWLKKRYFTPKSLMILIDYFIKSRLMYGMCWFMRTRNNVEGLDSAAMKHICKMYGLSPNTSQDRIRIILAEPNIEIKLAIRILKILYKYRKHFKDSPSSYRKQLIRYFSEEVVDGECDTKEYGRLAYELEQSN